MTPATAMQPALTSRARHVRRRTRTSGRVAGIASVLAVAATATVVGIGLGPGTAQAVADDDWLGIVNTYRAMSGLSPVAANGTWSGEARAHSCYMLQNGISHDELPDRAGYTPGGDVAGNSGNVAVSSASTAVARDHIDLWMTGPFHAIGILRHNLTTSGFGLCTAESTPTPWRSGGTLDVIRGMDTAKPRPTTPTLFPGDGATVPLNAFVTEYPNPLTLCGWTGSAGLPLIAMMPSDVTAANSTLTGPDGPIPTCTLHAGNTGADGTARSILDGDDAVVVVPRQVLADGTYTATVTSNGGNVTWSFNVDRDGPLAAEPVAPPEPETTKPTADQTKFQPVTPFRLVDSREGKGTLRLRAGKITQLAVGGSDLTAVSANFTAVRPAGSGYITAYNCTTELPTVSTLGYRPGQNVANQAIVPLQNGKLCLYSYADVDIIVDINGFYRDETSGAGFNPLAGKRLLDTRRGSVPRLEPMQARKVRVAGIAGGAPAGADGVALNVTAVQPGGQGWLRAYPCGSTKSSDISSVNYVAGDVRPNSVVVPVDGKGEICLLSSQPTDVLLDITGYFAKGAGFDFVPLDPIRLLDTRERWAYLNPFTNGGKVGAGTTLRVKVAGVRGVPADARAASVNVTATQAGTTTFVTAFPCGARPATSNVNLIPWQGVAANGAMVALSSAGELCIYVDQPAHVLIDINGIWR
jgi:uncharacterized protein YkwD